MISAPAPGAPPFMPLGGKRQRSLNTDTVAPPLADHLVGHAYVAAYDIEYAPVRLAALHQLENRDLQALFVDFAIFSRPAPAHIGGVRDHAAERDRASRVAEYGRYHADVLEMAAADPGVVRNHHISRMPAFFLHCREKVTHRHRQGANE